MLHLYNNVAFGRNYLLTDVLRSYCSITDRFYCSNTVMVFIVKSYKFEIDASLVWMKSVLFVLQNRKTIHIPNRDVLYCIDNSVRLQDLHKIMKFQL